MREISIGYMASEADTMLTALRAAFCVSVDDAFLVIDADAEAEETDWVAFFDGDVGEPDGWPDLLAGPVSRLHSLVGHAGSAEYVSADRVMLAR